VSDIIQRKSVLDWEAVCAGQHGVRRPDVGAVLRQLCVVCVTITSSAINKREYSTFVLFKLLFHAHLSVGLRQAYVWHRLIIATAHVFVSQRLIK